MALLQLKLKLSAFGISYDGVILSDFCHSVRDHTLRDWGLALFALRGLRHLVNIHIQYFRLQLFIQFLHHTIVV